MEKELIIRKMRENGCRITHQRRILLDVILENDCTCCKEIYYKAVKIDDSIGTATVYRMLNTLEEIGAISRKSMYQLMCGEESVCGNICRIEFEDGASLELSAKKWSQVVSAGLKEFGYTDEKRLRSITAKNCECLNCINSVNENFLINS